MVTPIEITYEDWFKQFKPVECDEGLLQEFSLEQVQGFNECRVWTLLDSDHIVEGIRIVNRVCYYVTEKTREKNAAYDVEAFITI